MRKKKETIFTKDVVVGIGIAVGIIGIYAAVGLYWWALFWSGVGAWLGFVEWLTWKKTGKTLSAQMGEKIRANPVEGYSLLLLLLAMALFLIWHFLDIANIEQLKEMITHGLQN